MSGDEGELFPKVFDGFNGVCFLLEGDALGDPCWGVPFFAGKSNRIIFRKNGDAAQIAEIEDITLEPAPTMTFLNPRPAQGSLPYPWSWDGGEHNHYIKLPLPLTYLELSQGSQIVVSGVTEGLNVIEGVVEENNEIHFRAGGALIASVVQYNGERDLVQIIVMEDFAGEILAVNFDKAYKNLPAIDSLYNEGDDGPYQYVDANNNKIARCVLNSYCLGLNPLHCLPSVAAGDVYRVYESMYVENVGNAIETSIIWGGRDLYVIQVGQGYKLKALIPNIEDGWKIQYPEI